MMAGRLIGASWCFHNGAWLKTPRWRPFLALLVLLLAIACMACARKSAKQPDTTLPRAAPSYMHWLQKQSMSRQAPEIIAQVSQSNRVWLQSSAPGRADVLLNAAPNWALLNAEKLEKPIFANASPLAASLPPLGINGFYLGDTGENPDIWLSKGHMAKKLNSASLQFDESFGSEEDFDLLAQTAENAGLQIGSNILAAATGRGPDFLLQARNSQGHAGLYAMLPAPAGALPMLPKAGETFDSLALDAATVENLAQNGVIPQSLARDNYAWASKGGWAATGDITGADGAPRRWLYRYALTPEQPVLAWQDPSGAAAKIFSASIIRNTGLLGQTLAGLRLEPLMGLEPGESGRISLAPGLDAINSLASQIHRYGGWAMQMDSLPASAISQILAGPCDFCRDDVTPALVIFGLLAADGRPVASLYRDYIAKGVAVSRMARFYNAASGPNPLVLADSDRFASQMAQLQAAGLPGMAKTLNDIPEEKRRHFLLTWAFGMPGLAFINWPGQIDPWLANLMRSRRDCGLAAGSAIEVIRGHGGGLGLLSKLPKGGFWLLACNFGVNDDDLDISLPQYVANARDAATGQNVGSLDNGRKFRIGIEGRGATNVILQ